MLSGRNRPLYLWLAATVMLANFIFIDGRLNCIDGELMGQLTASLGGHASLHLQDPIWATAGRDGLYYSKYGPAQSVAALPLFFLGKAFTAIVPSLPSALIETAALSFFNPIVLAGNAVLTAVLAGELGLGAFGACLAALLLIFGSCVGYYGKTFFSEPLQTLFLLQALLCAIRYRKAENPTLLWRAGGAIALAVTVKPTCLLLAPLILVYLGLRKPHLVAVGLPVLGAVGFLLGYNVVRFGNAFDFGYGEETFLHQPVGALGLLVSPRCGLIFYCPALCLGFLPASTLGQTYRRERLLLLANFWVWWFVFSFWPIWDGNGWGPRYLIPGLPGLAILASGWLCRQKRKTAVFALILACVLQLPSLLVSPGWFEYAAKVQIQQLTGESYNLVRHGRQRNWDFRFMPWVYQARQLGQILTTAPPSVDQVEKELRAYQVGQRTNVEISPQLLQRFNFKVIDIWPVYLSYLRFRFIAVAAWFSLGLIFLACAARLARVVLDLDVETIQPSETRDITLSLPFQ